MIDGRGWGEGSSKIRVLRESANLINFINIVYINIEIPYYRIISLICLYIFGLFSSSSPPLCKIYL